MWPNEYLKKSDMRILCDAQNVLTTIAFWNGEKNFCLARVPTDNVVWIVPDFHASDSEFKIDFEINLEIVIPNPKMVSR